MLGKHPIQFDYQRVKKLAALALTNEQCAAALGISRRTYQRKIAGGDELFAQAVEEGRALLAAEMSTILVESARSGNLDSVKFILERRLNWGKTDKVDLELKAAPVLNIILTGVDQPNSLQPVHQIVGEVAEE